MEIGKTHTMSNYDNIITEGDIALSKAVDKELERDKLFLVKCNYHNKLMEELFYNKGWTFINCYGDGDNYKSEVKAIFKEVGKRMEEKFPGYLTEEEKGEIYED